MLLSNDLTEITRKSFHLRFLDFSLITVFVYLNLFAEQDIINKHHNQTEKFKYKRETNIWISKIKIKIATELMYRNIV